jgi:adenylate cyclase class IV
VKITTFNPQIITKDAESAIHLFEELGFEQRHYKINSNVAEFHRMKDVNGFHIDIVQAPGTPREFVSIRMNVDDIEEAYDLLIRHGFRAAQGFGTGTESSKYAIMISPSGFVIDFIQHIKDHD